jgi:predicted transcriptional regulator
LKNRSKTDIVGLILEVANVGGATKTKIMYKAFLSYSQLKECLAMLMENSLLEFEEEKTILQNNGKRDTFSADVCSSS